MNKVKDQYLVFHLGSNQYAVTVEPVREIVEQPPLTVVPDAPPYIVGVYRRDDKTIPVMDLRLKWNMPPAQAAQASCIIVIEGEGGPFAIRADNVTAIITLHPGDLQSVPPAAVTPMNRHALSGIARLSGGELVVLSPDGLTRRDAA